MKKLIPTLHFCLAISFQSMAGGNPTELGTVNWLRDFDQATALSEKSQKPILILFQEVPGCATCRNYGRNVLSNPLLVEAIEQYFVPLAIYNNKGGKDGEILKKYKEPTWNNPVVRIIDEKGNNLVDRLSANYSAAGLYQSMKEVLNKQDIATDAYFELLGEELSAKKNGNIVETYFKMYCFWSGEGHLGKYDGVLSTEPGFMGGNEVVKVKYDASKIKQADLDKYAEEASCSKITKQDGYRIDKDPQYYLKKTAYRYLPLSSIQRSKINSAIGSGADASMYLSPTQKRWLSELENNNKAKVVLYEKSIEEAWKLKSAAENS